jgi:hypothetical protein
VSPDGDHGTPFPAVAGPTAGDEPPAASADAAQITAATSATARIPSPVRETSVGLFVVSIDLLSSVVCSDSREPPAPSRRLGVD